MRRRPLLLTAGLMATALTALSAQAATSPPPTQVPVTPVPNAAAQMSSNITHVGTIPVDAAGVSAEIVTRSDFPGTRFLYVSNVSSFDIYDFTDPAKPGLVGRLPLYNWENEALSVSKDGKTALISEFTGTGYTHVLDLTNPNLPMIAGSLAAGKDGTGKLASHTITCANPECTYAYGSEGPTYDLRVKTAPKVLPKAQWWGEIVAKGFDYAGSHAMEQDSSGTWIVDMTPVLFFQNTGDPALPFDPTRITRVLRGDNTQTDRTEYQHNTKRPMAEKWVPRKKVDVFGTANPAPGAKPATPLLPGELLLGEGETNFTGQCSSGSGALYSAAVTSAADAGANSATPAGRGAITQLDVFRPIKNSTYTDGDPAVNALGCSGHWFETRDADAAAGYSGTTIAAAWYEHGTRVIRVDPATGKFSQLGFFQPVQGTASSTYWVPGTDFIITIDYQRGIDILKFNPKAPVPTTAEFDASWMAKLGVVDQYAELERQLCKSNGKDMSARLEQAALVG